MGKKIRALNGEEDILIKSWQCVVVWCFCLVVFWIWHLFFTISALKKIEIIDAIFAQCSVLAFLQSPILLFNFSCIIFFSIKYYWEINITRDHTFRAVALIY